MGGRHARLTSVSLVAALLLLLLPPPAMGATRPGTEDLGFGSCGITQVMLRNETGEGIVNSGTAVAVQPDGRILVAGTPDRYDDSGTQVVTRLLPDGSVDLAFGVDGTARKSDFREFDARAIVRQADGRIVVAGTDVVYPYPVGYRFIRFTPDGTLDASFGSGGQVTVDLTGELWAMALQPDGSILGAGTSGQGGTVVRVTSSGARDGSFGGGGTVTRLGGAATALAVQADGRIIVGIDADNGTNSDFGLVRLLSTGAADSGFGSGGSTSVDLGSHDEVAAVTIDGAGRIVTVGASLSATGSPAIGLTRHLPSGALDRTFGDGGKVVSQPPSMTGNGVGVRIQDDGRIVVGADLQRVGDGRHQFGLARYSAAGALDGSFGTSGGFTVTGFGTDDGVPKALAVTPQGDWVLVGSVGGPYRGTRTVVRYKGDGSAAADNGTITAQNCTRTAQLSPEWAIDFGRQVVWGRSTVKTVTLRSAGTGALRISRVKFSLDNDGQFVLVGDTCTGATLPPGSSCTLALAFGPTKTDAGRNAMVMVWDNAELTSQAVVLSGTPTSASTPQAWGWNGFGQLGNGTTTDRAIPTPVGGLSGIVAVASGAFHDVALRNDGTVWASGLNNVGELGDNTTTDRHSPVPVPGFGGVVAVAAGSYHTLALKRDGTVWAWGWNYYGQLGDGSTVDRVLPVRVAGLTGVVAIAAGAYHSYALLKDGTVRAWGLNHVGQLGDGTTTDRHAPVPVTGLRDVTSIAGGAFHGLAVKTDGTARAWGWNYFGQLGDGTTLERHEPVAVSGVTDATAVATGGYYHSLALTRDGYVRAWGLNNVGELGDGTTVDRHSPVQVPGLVGVAAIAGGAYHSLAVAGDGTVQAWGWNYSGQLGVGSHDDGHVPVRIFGLNGVAGVSAGAYHSQAN